MVTTSRRLNRRIMLGMTAIFTSLLLTACGASEQSTTTPSASPSPSSSDANLTTLTVGAKPQPHSDILEFLADDLTRDEGLQLEIVEMTDHQIANSRLAAGELDANFVQHIPALNEDVNANGYSFSYGAGVHIAPYALFSSRYDRIEALPEGSTIGITSVAADQYRALRLLEAHRLLSDIERDTKPAELSDQQNPSGLQFKEYDTDALDQQLEDNATDAVIIHARHFDQAELNIEDALLVEGVNLSPHSSILVWNSSNEHHEAIQRLDELLHSDEVATYIEENWPEGEIIPAGQSDAPEGDDTEQSDSE
ncbi:MetQ/NlpA family ABC transporter substrate-binding protein [Yaniella flava]|uniref:MetQ/NlpA family ABC transporter substrate-binding protein n=1 Tax=Yaniella flava TaxID=287930 RepID=A0ABP5FX15_9MICC